MTLSNSNLHNSNISIFEQIYEFIRTKSPSRNFYNLLSVIRISVIRKFIYEFWSSFGKILPVIRTFLHFWQANWSLLPLNGLSNFDFFFFWMFWFLIQTSFKRVNTSHWYMERWRRGFTKNKSYNLLYKALLGLEKGTTNKYSAQLFGVPANTLSTWKKNKDKSFQAFQKERATTKRVKVTIK